MESYGLDMDDMFDEPADMNRDIADFEQPSQAENDNTQDDTSAQDGDISREVAEKLAQLKNGAAKKRVLRPQPKMDSNRLCGERGMPVLPGIFEKIKFRGKGHEIDDLFLMMKTYEHWAHRMFPRMPLDELIERLEKLGSKSHTQAVLSKIRKDMPVLEADFVSNPIEISDDEQERTNLDNSQLEPPAERMDFGDEEDNIDDLLNITDNTHTDTNNSNPALTASTPFPKSTTNTDTNQITQGKENQTPTLNESAAPVLTPELEEKIKQNREAALARMRVRQAAAARNNPS